MSVRSPSVTELRAAGVQGAGSLRIDRMGTGTPVALLHGFTQNARAWGTFCEVLSATHAVRAVDLPGHGGSTEIRADLWQTGDLVADGCGQCDYIGYSLGGRVLLHTAIRRPEVVGRAVLIGATAGIEDQGEREARIAADELIATELDDAGDDSGALGAFLSRWLAGPLFCDLTDEAAQTGARMENRASGLASSLRLCGAGTQEPLWQRVGDLAMPVLVIAGERDARFTILGEKLAQAIGSNARFAVVPGANHACQLERPEETAAIVEDFLSRTEAAPGRPSPA